ncbi:MAG: ribosome recycling factor [Gammaproteobacteria bacterium]|nr:ribosome recycling factor [Gammaproteobacteria bacterium]
MGLMEELTERMDAALDAARREFATVRTGKATPALLDSVRVDAYGASMPLNQLATVVAADASLLVVQPYDKSQLASVERAIMSANLGLNPSNNGNLIRVPIPPLTEERRREYVRIIHKMSENARISIRHARRAGNGEVKRRMREHEISDDQGHQMMSEIQKVTDRYVASLDELMKAKEGEVMAI